MATPPGDLEESSAILCELNTTKRAVEIFRFTHTWKIDDYTSRATKKGERISSSEFCTIDRGIVQKWRLETYPYVKDSRSKDLMSIYVRLLKNTEDAELMATASCHILNIDGRKVLSSDCMSNTMYNYTPGDAYAFKIKIDGDTFLNEANGLVIDDTLTILCEIDMMYNVVFKKTKIAERHLLNDFAQLLENEKSADITLNVLGREIPAHKTILVARSSVFSAMFEHNMMEEKQKCVDITDIDYETVYEMLRYIYTGEVKNIKKFADRLLAAAEKYDLDLLKKMCATTLKDNITTENAADILILADLNRCDELKRSAIYFISEFTTAVMRTESFKTIVKSFPHLTTELLEELAQKNITTEDQRFT